MNKLRNLLFIQLLTGFLIGLLLAIAGLVTTSKLIESEQLYHKELIKQFSYSNLIDDPKLLSKQIRASIDFEFLTIKDPQGNILYSYKMNRANMPLLTSVLRQANLLTEPQTLASPEGEIIVEFHSSYEDILKPLLPILVALVFVPLLIVIVSFLLFRSSMNQIFLQLSTEVAGTINKFIKSKTFETSEELKALPSQFTAISIALKKLNAYFSNTIEEFEKSASDLKSEAYKDSLTDLPNRTQFVEHFEKEAASDGNQSSFGVLVLIRATELQHINQSKGYQDGDKYIKGLSEVLINVVGTYSNASLYRLNGSDFGMILPNITVKEAESLAQTVHSRLNEYMRVAELSAVAAMGIVSYGNNRPLGELLASADTAISLAQTKHVNAWHVHKESNISQSSATAFGNQNWRNIIADVVEQNAVTLLLQPIQATNRGTKAYSEVLSRFKTDDDQVLPTASFLAMAEKLDRVIEIDQLIVEKVLDTIKTQSMADQFFGINLTPASVHNDQFMIWLERRLLKEANIATKLVFEITEFGLQQNVNSSRRFIDMVHRAGARVTVEKFGVGITSFKFFQELKPDFIKLDGSYTRGIEDEKNNQYFIRMIVDLSHRIGVNVLSECVETQEEKHILEQLFIDGCQGYYLGKPAPL